MKEKNQISAATQDFKATATRIIITCAALAFLAVHLLSPKVSIDNIAIALLVVAVVPWLNSVFKSIEVTGLGKAEFQREVKRLDATITDVKAQTNLAIQNSSFASGAAKATLATKLPYDPFATLRRLGQHYVQVRKAMPRGWQRTAEVTQIFGEMVAAASQVNDLDVYRSLHSDNEGERLAAIAYLYAKPDLKQLDDLVSGVCEHEDKGFNQYWGIKTIQKIIQQADGISGTNLNKLRILAAKTPPGTDRAHELSKILGDVYLERKGFPQI